MAYASDVDRIAVVLPTSGGIGTARAAAGRQSTRRATARCTSSETEAVSSWRRTASRSSWMREAIRSMHSNQKATRSSATRSAPNSGWIHFSIASAHTSGWRITKTNDVRGAPNAACRKGPISRFSGVFSTSTGRAVSHHTDHCAYSRVADAASIPPSARSVRATVRSPGAASISPPPAPSPSGSRSAPAAAASPVSRTR